MIPLLKLSYRPIHNRKMNPPMPLHVFFASEDGYMTVVNMTTVQNSYVLADMVETILDIGGQLDEPFILPISSVHMKKIFAFYESHEEDAEWYNQAGFYDPSALTDEDCELFEITEEFNYNHLTELLQIAVEFGFRQLEAAIGEYLAYFNDSSDDDDEDLPPLVFDVDSDEKLTPEEEEELRQRYDWIRKA